MAGRVTMRRYKPSRHYITAGVVATLFALFSAWWTLRWEPSAVAAILFALTGAFLFHLALRPTIEIRPEAVRIGDRSILWTSIRRLDRTGWISPLAVYLTLDDGARVLVVYPGKLADSSRLLHDLSRHARLALIDGVPHHEVWGEPVALRAAPVPEPEREAVKYPLLTPDDEAEVERLFQRLKTVGHLDPRNSQDEK